MICSNKLHISLYIFAIIKAIAYMNKSIIDRLKSISPSESSIDELYEIFDLVQTPLIMPLKLPVDNKIIRLRPNKTGEVFTCKSDLSYPPSSIVKTYGRANIPGFPMFYGAIFSENKNVENATTPRVVVLSEVSDFFRDSEREGKEIQTYSVWKTKDELRLIAFPFSENYNNPCDKIIQINNQWEKLIGNYYCYDDSVLLAQFMSDEIRKDVTNEKGYFLLAHYIHCLMYQNQLSTYFDGILYPTVKGEGNGFNIALKPEVVDKSLHLIGVHECLLAKKKGNTPMLLPYREGAISCNSTDIVYSKIDDLFNNKELEKYLEELDFIN